MAEIILHHYPQSPVAEKARVALGIKGLAWDSVIIPRVPPKPDLMPLTGGYRRTPVMQIGADIYCDSQCILRELERRYPEPSLIPGQSAGLVWGVSRWTDGPLLDLAVKVVLGAQAEDLPADFAADRGRLYLGPDWDFKAAKADLPHLLAQLRGQLGWIDQRLATGRPFLLGEQPALPDVLTYYLIWFIRGRWEEGPALLSEFAALEAWEARVAAIGHGQSREISSVAALEVAREAAPQTAEGSDPRDPQGLRPGMTVSVVPEGIGDDPAVEGRVRSADRETIVLLREDEPVGAHCIHFPRVGYRVTRLS